MGKHIKSNKIILSYELFIENLSTTDMPPPLKISKKDVEEFVFISNKAMNEQPVDIKKNDQEQNLSTTPHVTE